MQTTSTATPAGVPCGAQNGRHIPQNTGAQTRETATRSRGDRPLAAYAGLIGVFNAILGLFFLYTRSAGKRLPEKVGVNDMVMIGVATHQLSRVITRDKITTVLRAPFTRVEGHAELPGELEEVADGHGLRRAIGELLSCPYCIGAWIAALFSFGLVLAPSPTRLIASIFSSLTVSDFLHAAYRMTNNAADRLSDEGLPSDSPGIR